MNKTQYHQTVKTMKSIADKKINIHDFCQSQLSDFLTNMIYYLLAIANKKKYNKLKKKYILESLQQIISTINPSILKEKDYVLFSSLFSILMEPSSPVEFLLNVQELFLQLLIIVPYNYIISFEKNLKILFPFNQLATSIEEIELFDSCNNNSLIQLFPKKSSKDINNSIALFSSILTFIEENYTTKQILCHNLLFGYVFKIVFFKIEKELNYENLGFGFLNKIPYAIETKVICFIRFFSKNNLEFLTSNENLRLMIHILDELSKIENVIDILLKFTESKNIITTILNNFPDDTQMIFTIIKNSIYYSEKTPDDYQVFSLFISQFISSILYIFDEIELIHFIDNIFNQFEFDHSLLCSTYFSLLKYLFENNLKTKSVWDSIINKIMKSEIYAFINSKFAQYIALINFLEIFQINRDSLIEFSVVINKRRARNKIKSEFDWLLDNVEIIINNPSSILKILDYNIFKFQCDFDFYVPKILFNSDEMIDFYFSLFDEYINQTNEFFTFNLYATLYSYFSVLLELSKIPYQIDMNRNRTIEICANRLFNAILFQNNLIIIKQSLKMLKEIILKLNSKFVLDNEILSKWYLSIVMCLFHKDVELSEIGFQCCERSICLGFIGSSFLVPILISFIKANPNPNYISFLCSVPLFNISYSLEFNNQLLNFIEEKPFILNCISLLKRPCSYEKHDIISSVFDLVNNIQSKSKEYEKIMSFYFILIVNELTIENPNQDIILRSFENLIKIAQDRSLKALLLLKDVIVEFEEPIKKKINFSKIFTKIIMLKLSTFDDLSYIFHKLSLIVEVIILFYDLVTHDILEDITTKIKYFNNKFDNTFFCFQMELLIFKLSYQFQTSIYKNPFTYRSFCNISDCNQTYLSTHSSLIQLGKDNEDRIIVDTNVKGYSFRWNFQNYFICKEGELEYKFNEQQIMEPIQEFNNNILFEKFNSLIESNYKFLDEMIISNISEEVNTAYNNYKMNNSKDLIKKVRPSKKIATFSSVVSSIGFQTNKMKFISKNDANMLKVKKIQKSVPKSYHKIAIVYASQNIKNQNEVLSTEWKNVSPLFKEFLQGIGWNVDLRTHYFYDGGLDTVKYSNGKSSIFYTDNLYEIMFHVSPLIPTDPNDSQQIYKKRHIGNDHIHIIWCEDDRDYDISLITSQFNQVHIVIYPLQTGLFRVDVFNKNDVDWFGPLRKSTLVTKKELPSLVRITALNAMVTINEKIDQYRIPPLNGIENIFEIDKSIKTGNSKIKIHSSN